MKSRDEIMQLIEEEDVEFVRLQFVDVFGNLKNLAVTTGQIDRVLNGEYFFDGAAMFDNMVSYGEKFYLYPDLDSFVIIPWRPQQRSVGKFICDVYKEDGTPFLLSPRTILKNVIKQCNELGYKTMVDSDCEFFLFHTDENGIPTIVTHERAGYMDVGPIDLGENARREIVLNLEDMGFEVESSHHEKAPAQHEIDFRQSESLKTADALMTFKFAVRSIAKRFGLYATFMPKPKSDCAGSGMHLNFALYKDGRNVFEDEKVACSFMGGILKYAPELCVITNPIVNSYKRIMSGFDPGKKINWKSGYTDKLVKQSVLFGVSEVEVCFPDPTANPYLAIAVCLAAGLKGIEEQLDGEALLSDGGVGILPDNLKDATLAFKNSSFMRQVLGDEFVDIYSAVKEQEWREFILEISDWELDRYLAKI